MCEARGLLSAATSMVGGEPNAPGTSKYAITHVLGCVVGETATVGEFGGAASPVVVVEHHDELITSTLGLWGGAANPGMKLNDVLELRKGFEGRGPHTLTGPIDVYDAVPGDAIGVQILGLTPGKHGINLATPAGLSRGVLADRFPAGFLRHFEIDVDAGVARSGGLAVPLAPTLGFIGLAPADDRVRNSVVPEIFGGNLDISQAGVGSTVWLPVQREGGCLYVGDGHAVQGDGEVNGTAIECDMDRVRIKILVAKNARLTSPRIETAEALISVGLGVNLEEAVQAATLDLVAWLEDLGVHSEDAYAMCSIAGSLKVSQVVNKVVGVHFSLSRGIVQAAGKCPTTTGLQSTTDSLK